MIKEWIGEYEPKNSEDVLSALREIMQEVALAGLSRTNFFELSEELFKANDLTFKTMSVTSSLTPFIDVNSCKTPSICIDVTAAPLIDESNILLKELPKVSP